MNAHARLGGSVAPIFTACTGAPALWGGRARKATVFTREGTLAHALIEERLKHVGDKIPVAALGSTRIIEGEPVEVTAEMLWAVDLFCTKARDLAHQSKWAVVEEQFDLDSLWTSHNLTPPERLFGTVDFASFCHEGVLTIMDFKYGKGVSVPIEWNAQLLYYALLVYFAALDAVKIKTVKLIVCQPRAAVAGEEFKEWEISPTDLLLWGYTVLRPAVDAIVSGQGTKLVAGKHCMFCVAKGDCPALYEEAKAAAKGAFPPVAPTVLTDFEIDEALKQADMLSAWINGVRQEGERRIREGRSLPSWKMVAKKGYRQWRDEILITGLLTDLGLHEMEIFEPREIKSPAKIEKTLKMRSLDPKTILAGTIDTPVTGATLVPVSDKRPAVPVAPQDVFSDAGEPD